ncbi:hypothetical protein BKD09_18800 [Bradyrhizobium japonicum]|uniref:Uncharacterized protein n=1 Tax=Bradyrhizobium japonicum TaxID=375 RepID=A0A1L3FAW5_BRAJP|nr:hypothetical protein BKD09_18800 [Bradyrhizobium japonicum]
MPTAQVLLVCPDGDFGTSRFKGQWHSTSPDASGKQVASHEDTVAPKQCPELALNAEANLTSVCPLM